MSAITDPDRLAALAESGLLEPGHDMAQLARLTRLTTEVLGLHAAISVVDATTQHVIAKSDDALAPPQRSPVEDGVCALVVADGTPLHVEDARASERDPIARYGVGSYAGEPLRTSDGHILGVLCVYDEAPRPFDARELALLADLAAVATAHIDLGRLARRLAAHEAELALVVGSVSDLLHVVEAEPPHRIVTANTAFLERRGLRAEDVVGRAWGDVDSADSALRTAAILAEVRDSGRPARFAETISTRDGERSLDCLVSPVRSDGTIERLLVVGRDISEHRLQERSLQESLAERERLLAEQVALRRVAEVAAQRGGRRRLYAVIGHECAELLGGVGGGVTEFVGNDVVMRGGWHRDGESGIAAYRDVPVPTRASAASARVRETGRPVLLGPDAADDPSGFGGRAQAPIRVDGRLWGAIGVAAAPGESLPEGSELRLARFAEIAGVAIADDLARSDLDRRLRQEQILADATSAMFHSRTAHEVQTLAVEAARACLPSAILIGIFRPDEGAPEVLRLAAGHGWGDRIGRRTRRVGDDSLVGQAAARDAAVIVADIAAEPEILLPLQTPSDVRCAIAVPIPSADGPSGVLSCGATRPRAFGDDDLVVVQTLVNALGSSLGRIRHEARLEEAARTDALTGLPNRDHVRGAIEAARAGGRDAAHGGVAVLLIDLDRFKLVNDLHGHAFGDRTLHAVAQRLSPLAAADDVLARFGGDEFVLLVRSGGLARAEATAARVQAALREPFDVDGVELAMSASIGIVVPTAEQSSAEDVLRDADVALYRAKDAGRGRAVAFDGEMRAALLRRGAIERDLRSAIGHDLHLAYQPVIDLADGRVLAFEALARWPHPDGPIGPAEFVAVAEESGLIRELGHWAVTAACTEAAAWRRALTTAPPVLVNVSAAELGPELPALVARALEATGLPASSLALEVTERALIDDAPATHEAIARLAALGVRIYLDDFGTGQSALSVLHRFQIHGVKLDRSFTARLPGDRAAAAIVHATVAMARELSLDLIAEGVETQEQVDVLRRIGCPSAQGYLYAAPLDADDALHLAAARGVRA